jgi:hypothetical protein
MNYAQKARDADAQFRSKGQLITIARTVKGSYVAGRVTSTTSTESAWGIETDLTSRDYGVGTAAGSLVQAGDRKLLLSAYADNGAPLTQPSVGDVVNVGPQAYTIKNVDRTAPAGIVVMWTLVVRI